MSTNQNGELVIKRSASRDLKFAMEHGVKYTESIPTEPVFIGDDADDQTVIAESTDTWASLVDDCDRDTQKIDDIRAVEARVTALEARADCLRVRVDALEGEMRSV